MKINYTWVRRIHFINNEKVFYLTIRIFGKRFHWCKDKTQSN